MTTIRETVADNLSASYMSYADPAIAALEEREQQAIDTLHGFASSKGLSDDEFFEVMEQAGLIEPEPEVPEPALDSDTDLSATVAALTEQVAELGRTVNAALEAARRQGVRI